MTTSKGDNTWPSDWCTHPTGKCGISQSNHDKYPNAFDHPFTGPPAGDTAALRALVAKWRSRAQYAFDHNSTTREYVWRYAANELEEIVLQNDEAALASTEAERRCDGDHRCQPYHELTVKAYPGVQDRCSVHGGKFAPEGGQVD